MKKTYRHISCAVTNIGVKEKNGIRPVAEDLHLLFDAAIVYDDRTGILWVGHDKNLPRSFKTKPFRQVDAKYHVAYPGLVDCHSHLVFAGDRSLEFEMRMQGASYAEIAKAGGGILRTMNATRKAGTSELVSLVKKRLATAHEFGIRLMEAKSGYGLDFESEKKSLLALAQGAQEFGKINLQSTLMAAHAIPPEFKHDRGLYVEQIITKFLPKLKKLAMYCDVFCDEGFFTLAETKAILAKAKEMGYELRLHGEELANTGAAELAASLGARSVDHLLKISDGGIKALAKSQTIGVLLPSTSFYLKEPAAPARKLIDQGVAIALATDFNPGTSPTQNLPLVGTLAAIHLGMTTAEIITAITFNAARSLGQEKNYGVLCPGFKGEPVFCEGDHPSALFYQLAPAKLPQL